LQGRVLELQSSLDELRAKYHKSMVSAEEMEVMQEKVKRQDDELRRLRAEAQSANDLKAQLRDITSQFRSCQETLEHDKQKHARDAAHSEERLARLEQELTATQSKLHTVADENAKFLSAHAELTPKIEELSAHKTSLEARCDALQRKVAASETAYERQVGELSDRNRKMDEDSR